MQGIMEEFIGVRHIFVAHSTEGARDKIGAAKARIDAGEKLSTVMADFNEDTDMSSQGLYIMKGYMNKEYEDVAFSLGVGDVSGIVEDELGFYIIERIKLTPQEILLRFDYLKELYQSYTFYSIIDKKQAELVFTPTDAGKSFMDDPLAFLK
jgi:parvulin-like peptidyl-prolyl isomerase